eukprot:9480036-Pyramimonas_sp.AAC.1
MGVPSCIIRALRFLYAGIRATIVLGGQRFPGFEIESGIKLGCPASGSIFALSLDPIVRALVCALPEPES